MVRALTDPLLIDAVLAEAGRTRQWRGVCANQDRHHGTRFAARLKWREGDEVFLAIRHRQPDGQASAVLLSAPAGRDGEMQIDAAADALDHEFRTAAEGFERLLEALKG